MAVMLTYTVYALLQCFCSCCPEIPAAVQEQQHCGRRRSRLFRTGNWTWIRGRLLLTRSSSFCRRGSTVRRQTPQMRRITTLLFSMASPQGNSGELGWPVCSQEADDFTRQHSAVNRQQSNLWGKNWDHLGGVVHSGKARTGK